MDGKAATDFDSIDEFIATHGLDLAVAEQVAKDGGLRYDMLINVFDRSIIEVENRVYGDSIRRHLEVFSTDERDLLDLASVAGQDVDADTLLEFCRGQLAGYNVDLARLICAELDLPCTIQRRSWELLIPALNDNSGDAVIAALAIIGEKTGKDPLEQLEASIKALTPQLEVRSRRVGGATYQVPVEVRPRRASTLAIRWVVGFSRARREKTMTERLMNEILDASNGLGAAVKKREDTHKMAESNKAFAHYRW